MVAENARDRSLSVAVFAVVLMSDLHVALTVTDGAVSALHATGGPPVT